MTFVKHLIYLHIRKGNIFQSFGKYGPQRVLLIGLLSSVLRIIQRGKGLNTNLIICILYFLLGLLLLLIG